jgi:hypothetical protein
MLPIPNPCGKFGKFLSAAAGAMGGFNSFPAETPVQVRPAGAAASAAQAGQAELQPIGALQPGDEVLAWSEWKEPGSDPQADARLSYEKVQQVITSTREQHLVHLTLDSGETITATAGHPFRTREGWRDAVLLKKGGQLLLKGDADDEDGSERWATVAEVRQETRTVQVFNLEVANAHTFLVGKDGVVVHNYIPPPRGPLPGFPGARRNGHTAGRARWNLPDGAFLLWDSLHGRCEKHNKRGKHMGEYDIDGNQTKPPNPGYDLPRGSF